MKKTILTITILLFSLTAFSQAVNFRRVQNAKVINISTGDTLSSHSSDMEALQQLYNNQAQGINAKMLGSVYELDINNDEPTWNEIIVIDTVQITGFNYSSIRSPKRAVINYGSNIMVATKDTVLNMPYYTFTARLERSKHWPTATTSYKLVDFPFYFHKSDSIYPTTEPTTMRARTFANATHCINHYINGVKVEGTAKFGTKSCGPGVSTYAGGSFRHSNTFFNLKRDIVNIIKVEAIDSVSGQVLGSQQFTIPKL